MATGTHHLATGRRVVGFHPRLFRRALVGWMGLGGMGLALGGGWWCENFSKAPDDSTPRRRPMICIEFLGDGWLAGVGLHQPVWSLPTTAAMTWQRCV